MRDFERQQGIAFLILYFSHRDEIYYMPFAQVLKFWERGRNGGLKHFKFTELEPQWFLRKTGNILVPFLEGVQRDLEQRIESDCIMQLLFLFFS